MSLNCPKTTGNVTSMDHPCPLPYTQSLPLKKAWSSEALKEGAVASCGYDEFGIRLHCRMEDHNVVSNATEDNQKLFLMGDVAEFFIMPSQRKGPYWEIHVSPNNLIMDVYIANQQAFFSKEITWEEAISYNSGSQKQVTVFENGWSCELQVPWKAFALDKAPETDTRWRFAVCRYNYDEIDGPPDLSSTADLTELNFHRVEEYTELIF